MLKLSETGSWQLYEHVIPRTAVISGREVVRCAFRTHARKVMAGEELPVKDDLEICKLQLLPCGWRERARDASMQPAMHFLKSAGRMHLHRQHFALPELQPLLQK